VLYYMPPCLWLLNECAATGGITQYKILIFQLWCGNKFINVDETCKKSKHLKYRVFCD